MKQEHLNEIKAIIILAIGMILLASLISFVPEDLAWFTSQPNTPPQNLIRLTGAYTAGTLLFVFGYSVYALVFFMFFWSWNKFCSREIVFSFAKFLSILVLFAVVSSLLSMCGAQDSVARFSRSGVVGMLFSDFLVANLGRMGAMIILFMLGTLSFILSAEVLVTPLFFALLEKCQAFAQWVKAYFQGKADQPKKVAKKKAPKIKFGGKSKRQKEKVVEAEDDEEDEDDEYEYVYEEVEEDEEDEGEDEEEFEEEEEEVPQKPKIRIAQPKEDEVVLEKGKDPIVEGQYVLPSMDLLDDPPEVSTNKLENSLMKGAKLLEDSLAQFGVRARVADIERGPVITRYELEPGMGVKVQQFTSLSDDIALVMKVGGVRVAPIPGKNRVGIEVPNGGSAVVALKDVLTSGKFQNAKSKLTLSLGKDISGAPMIADLASMPHMLIAGTTGAGKTVCVNGIIMSILMNASPEDVRFVMVDPKMVELAQYNEIPHLLCPAVTDPKKASAVLNWVVGEMEARYKKLAKAKVRNIKGYNDAGYKMPYIVVIVDELADLMQVSAKTVESSITRLAQLSRAVGIHLILATQRPSVDVITGVIKANFPARVSFKVASKVDSRTVLDMNGAESLLGRGDMLFIQPGDAKPTRGQCSYVKDEEINRVIQHIKDQQAPTYDDSILAQQQPGPRGGVEQKDEYYDEAVRLVIETNQASVSILQRRMRLGYTRAARLIDMMEQGGIVGPYCGSKPRELLVDREQWLLENMEQGEVDE